MKQVFPKIGGKTPKWMVYNGKPYEQMDDLGGFYHPYFGNTGNIWIYVLLDIRWNFCYFQSPFGKQWFSGTGNNSSTTTLHKLK